MAMNTTYTSFIPSISCNSLPSILALLILISPTFCSNPNQFRSNNFKGLVAEGKARLGSAPPSCYNKCNECHPCTAVQVPPFSVRRRRVEPSSLGGSTSPEVNRYSNYKPLGWKCRCADRFYNP